MQTMGLDNELTAVLREFVQFLESLRDVKLPQRLEDVRENLLSKFKAKLSSVESRECSPEAYLDMTVNKGLFISTENLDDPEEYVKHDPLAPPSHVEYYETFQELPIPRESKAEVTSPPDAADGTEDNHLVDVYSQFTVAQTQSQCEKCGILQVKKKILFLGPLEVGRKSVFVGLVGTHLLIYGNDKNQPSCVIPLRGYQARISISKNQKQSENTFEVCRPGHRTLKFVASDPKDMMEWIHAISEMGRYENERVQEKSRRSSELINSKRSSLDSISVERYQDVGLSNPEFCKVSKEVTSDQSSLKSSNSDIPPPLPNRTNRKLPKLPEEANEKAKPNEDEYNNQSIKSSEDPYNENIYHKIEDFSKERYQNCMVIQKMEEQNRNYDDIEINSRLTIGNRKSAPAETYDDINSIVSLPVGKQGNGTINDATKTEEKEKGKKNQTKMPKKLRHKRSFLDRMRRKSLKSVGDFAKAEALEIPCTANSDPEDQPMYVVPPKPRPVYPLPQIPNEESEQLYDDIESCKKLVQEEEERLKNNLKNNSLENILSSHDFSLKTENGVESGPQQPEEELYDDIAIWTDFKNRQRQHTASPEKRPWSRFGSGKMKIFDFSNSLDLTKSDTTETEDNSEPVTTKVTSFKRLINKMENSLGKAPIKVQSNGVI